jgi:flagellar hook-length control protein FliK
MKARVAKATAEKPGKIQSLHDQRAKPAKPGKFVQLLEAKQAESTGPIVPMAMPLGLPKPQTAPVQPAAEPRAVEALAREIVEHVEVSPGERRSQIDIQFNSRTLDGLHVRLVQENGCVSVQFTTASVVVARVVDENVPALRQALESRGIPLAELTVRRGRPRRGGR